MQRSINTQPRSTTTTHLSQGAAERHAFCHQKTHMKTPENVEVRSLENTWRCEESCCCACICVCVRACFLRQMERVTSSFVGGCTVIHDAVSGFTLDVSGFGEDVAVLASKYSHSLKAALHFMEQLEVCVFFLWCVQMLLCVWRVQHLHVVVFRGVSPTRKVHPHFRVSCVVVVFFFWGCGGFMMRGEHT